MKKILVVFGTRPEAIKMATLIKSLQDAPLFRVEVCVTAQHREMLDQVLNLFDIEQDFDLNLMQENQKLEEITSRILEKMPDVLGKSNPDIVLVHGDTTTTFSVALSAFYKNIPVGHVEAGLRTGNIKSPWPEEANRKLASILTSIHFAPTSQAKENLINEGIPSEQIYTTGNTVIDSLLFIKNMFLCNQKILSRLNKQFDFLDENKKLVLITGHRRENFGNAFERICLSLRELIEENNDIEFVYPVHLNPKVQLPVKEILSGINHVHLIEPLDYLPFVYLMNRSHIILTDSGGIQEEAPSLGKPVLVMRDTTERPEALESGTVRLVGTNKESIKNNILDLIRNDDSYNKMSFAHNPYGDGTACAQITRILEKKLCQ